MDGMKPYAIDDSSSFESLVMGEVKAGFPSPAEDIREKLDLVKLLVKHKASTFFFRIDGVSMVDAAMDDGDIIIVDRAIEPLRWLYHILHLRQRESLDAPEW